ncbi:Ig-like domain-containing protein [Alteromonas gilva]|uniref:Ig-like domain-containing protein n=1 Tax=Alteromonas gilva TaxID=2987522 RepID=A0ABT5L2S2_9ALTE|nr:Ig-like domain-containing protein [Alteromonas gilva]MDC8831345.1 Ig-like domain-containing protein [Alteromonas gilva]
MNVIKKLTLALLVLVPLDLAAQTLTLDDLSPVVVTSTPVAGSSAVAPSTKEITVTFSKDMMTQKMWSVVQVEGANFPKITGQVYFKSDGRTFVIPVALGKNTVYALSINSRSHTGFKDLKGKPAQPYILSFKTSG